MSRVRHFFEKGAVLVIFYRAVPGGQRRWTTAEFGRAQSGSTDQGRE